MELKRITKIAIFLIVSLVIAVFAYIHYGLIIFWDGVILILKGVSGISALSYLLKWVFSRELNEIDNDWHKLYEPATKAIEEFKKTIHPNADLKDYTNELYDLEKTLMKIETNYNHDFEYSIQQLIKKVLGNPQAHSMNNLNRLSEAIEEQINKLRNSRQWWNKW
jgi:hypothetical protein